MSRSVATLIDRDRLARAWPFAAIAAAGQISAIWPPGLATGFFTSPEEVQKFWRAERIFEPRMDADQRESLAAGWRDAVTRCRMRTGATPSRAAD